MEIQKEVPMHHEKCLELARFYHAVKNKQLVYVHQFVEKNPHDVNQRIPSDSFFCDFMPDIVGCTLLHVAYTENDIDAYRFLLCMGADFTLKNQQGSTVVHQIVESSCNEDLLTGRFKNPFLAATLFAHYEYRIRRNPRNPHGITHLHAACMANSADTVVELLSHSDYVSTVNQAVDINSPCYPAYTPLHFAMRFSELCTLETIKILIKHGADVNAEDKDGLTPLDVLLEKRSKIVETMKIASDYCTRDLLKALVANEKIIRFILDDCRVDDLSRVSKFIMQ